MNVHLAIEKHNGVIVTLKKIQVFKTRHGAHTQCHKWKRELEAWELNCYEWHVLKRPVQKSEPLNKPKERSNDLHNL